MEWNGMECATSARCSRVVVGRPRGAVSGRPVGRSIGRSVGRLVGRRRLDPQVSLVSDEPTKKHQSRRRAARERRGGRRARDATRGGREGARGGALANERELTKEEERSRSIRGLIVGGAVVFARETRRGGISKVVGRRDWSRRAPREYMWICIIYYIIIYILLIMYIYICIIYLYIYIYYW